MTATMSHAERAVAALRTLRELGSDGEKSEKSEKTPPAVAPELVWDEQAACLLVGSWTVRAGAGWPAGLPTTAGEAGALWDRFQRDLDAAFARQSWPALLPIFEEFRRGIAPLIRAWRRSRESIPALPNPGVSR